MFGIRTDLQITLLSERYMTNDAAGSPAGGQYGFVAWWRGDIQVAREKAFGVITRGPRLVGQLKQAGV